MEENQSRKMKDPVSTSKDISEKSFIPEGHALMNAVVLDNIISQLDYSDLKNVRLVCHRWKDVTRCMFWKMSKIKVAMKMTSWILTVNELEERAVEIVEGNEKLTDSFESAFPSPAELPTDAMMFEGCINRRTLEYFWKERGSLTLTNVYFQLFCEPTQECIDLNRCITPKLTTLRIGPYSLHHKFTVSLKMLTNIQHLRLDRCDIILDGKIIPRKLDLIDCNVTYEGKQFKSRDPGNRVGQKVLINEFVDFSKIKILCLFGNYWKMDVGRDTSELEHLALYGIELIGLGKSQWKTNFVDLTKGCTLFGEKMEIKTITDINNEDIEIQSLPKTVEHIWFETFGSFIALPRRLICSYPKLKSLTFRIIKEIPDMPILDFTNCTSLTDFQLGNFPRVLQMDFNRIILPNSIKNVKLSNVIPNSDVSWQLDTLVLNNYSLSSVERALTHFTATKVAIKFDSKLERDEDLMFIVNHWRNSSMQQLAFGEIDWPDTSSFLNSEFRKSVDGMGKFFLFTDKGNNGKGEVIDKDRFGSLICLNLHKDFRQRFI